MGRKRPLACSLPARGDFAGGFLNHCHGVPLAPEPQEEVVHWDCVVPHDTVVGPAGSRRIRRAGRTGLETGEPCGEAADGTVRPSQGESEGRADPITQRDPISFT